MRPDLAEKLASLPTSPGVYIMKDAGGEVFYVGKAKSLRDRVRSYFSGQDTRPFVALLDHLLADLEVVLTNSEKEALLVEDDLVKRYQPRFNVDLKDDKRFLCLRLDPRETYPRLQVVRRFGKDGARYFGPYTSAASVREALRLINRHFQLRTCTDSVFATRRRPCLQYQIKRCPAPCVYDLSHGEYAQNVENVVSFLSGDERGLLEHLQARMRTRSAELAFEAAAQLRDQIRAVERSLERQRVVTSDFASRDVVGLYREGPAVEVHVMRIRDGRLVDALRFSFDGRELPTSELLDDFAARFYAQESDIPVEILFPPEMEWSAPLAELLAERSKRAVEVRAPQRGDKRRLVELASRNAAQAFRDKQRERGAARSAVERLQRALHLSKAPRSLECFDISHMGGTGIVASCVRFEDGVSRKDLYRHYKVRSTAGQDDFQSMYEVIGRRARRGLEEADLPDLLVIDGGKGQLNAARAALDDNGIDGVDVIALAKAKLSDEPGVPQAPAAPETPATAAAPARRRGRATSGTSGKPDRVFVLGQKNAIELGENSAELFLLTRARDEAHRFAITFQRRQRKRAVTRSLLEDVPGIGPGRRRALLKTFGSVAQLRAASLDEVAKVVGRKAAETLATHLAATLTASSGGDEGPDGKPS